MTRTSSRVLCNRSRRSPSFELAALVLSRRLFAGAYRKYKAARLVINALSEHPDHAINPSLSACAI
jgi:hypothetical protein